MKLYDETMRYDVRLPKHAGEIIESEARRTGIQRAVLLRHIILDWIDKKNTNPAIGAGLGGISPNAGGHKLRELVQMDLEHKSKKTFSIQQMPNGGTRIFCIFIGAGESVIMLEIVGDEDNPIKTERRWYDRVKYFVGYVIRNWWLLVFVWDIFFEMLMQV